MNSKALQKIEYGMFVVCSKKDGAFNGQIANTVFQVAADPALIAVSLAKLNLTHDFVTASKAFTVSVLTREATMPFIGRFGFKSGRTIDKFKETGYRTGTTGIPIVTDFAAAFFEATVITSLDTPTHTVFIGTIVDADLLSAGEPMTYAYYHAIKGGLTPKNAPTFAAAAAAAAAPPPAALQKYTCTVCGYVYDPANGDPGNGIPPGTLFEKLPATWTCPVCGAPKTAFEPAK
jgi:flavin reductase (DIM6/NTAB) family NADH-FMN oxidoreductase RutF/rubredoxin